MTIFIQNRQNLHVARERTKYDFCMLINQDEC